MTNYRRMNWSPLEPVPPIPKPMAAPLVDQKKCQGLDGAIYVYWTYTQKDADTIDGYVVRVAKDADPTTILQERWVAEPDTDVILNGLTNGTAYRVSVAARNSGGEGSAGLATITPAAPIIPTPTLATLTGGDGEAIATWTWGTPLKAGMTWDWMSYEAVNEVGTIVTEHVHAGEWPSESGSLALTNDHDWTCALVAVAHDDTTGKQYVSGLSNQKTIHTEKPIPPYKPRLTGAQIAASNNGQIDVAFQPGVQNMTATRPTRWWRKALRVTGRTGPADINAWQVRVTKDGDSTTTTSYDITDGAARTYTTPKVGLGTWIVDCRAKNDVGWSDWSNQLSVTYKPTDSRPFTADKPFGSFEDMTYYYAIFDPGNDVKTGWDDTWKLTVATPGAGLAFDFIAIGAGGGGKGTTATLGKGGNGGGGTPLYGTIPGQAAGATITVFVSKGGSTAIDPKDTRITAATVYLAPAGKSASGAADAAGASRDRVPAEWWDTMPFRWNQPLSTYVGGVAETANQSYPDAIRWGEAGAGTKNSSPGKGYEGLVVLRWKK